MKEKAQSETAGLTGQKIQSGDTQMQVEMGLQRRFSKTRERSGRGAGVITQEGHIKQEVKRSRAEALRTHVEAANKGEVNEEWQRKMNTVLQVKVEGRRVKSHGRASRRQQPGKVAISIGILVEKKPSHAGWKGRECGLWGALSNL